MNVLKLHPRKNITRRTASATKAHNHSWKMFGAWLLDGWRNSCGALCLFLSIGWGCRIREVGRFSRNRVVLVFDPKDGWLVVAWRLIPSISGLGNG